MCGSATFTMVVSSTWISVADITARMIISRSVPVGSSCGGATLAGGALLISVGHRHQDAAGDAVEQRLLVGLAPPAREAGTLAMSHHDQVRTDAPGHFGDPVNRVAVLEGSGGRDSMVLQPLHALVQQRHRAAV